MLAQRLYEPSVQHPTRIPSIYFVAFVEECPQNVKGMFKNRP